MNVPTMKVLLICLQRVVAAKQRKYTLEPTNWAEKHEKQQCLLAKKSQKVDKDLARWRTCLILKCGVLQMPISRVLRVKFFFFYVLFVVKNKLF